MGSWASYSRKRTGRPSWLSRTTPTNVATAPSRLPATDAIIAPTSIGSRVRKLISAARGGRDEGHLGAVGHRVLPARVLLVDRAAQRRPHRGEPGRATAQLGEDPGG